MKKIFVTLLSIVFMINLVNLSVAAASDIEQENIQLASSSQSVERMFAVESEKTNDISVKYSYKFMDTKSDDTMFVDLTGYIQINDMAYPLSVSGEVDKIMIDNSAYYEGPLRGVIEINKMSHDITLGFRYFEETAEMSAGLTIYPNKDDKQASNAVFLMFGDFIKDDMIRDRIDKIQKEESPSSQMEIDQNNAEFSKDSIETKGTFVSDCRQRSHI